jgi:hypothetical protein
MINTTVGAASRYGSGSDKKMRLLAAPALQHWPKVTGVFYYKNLPQYIYIDLTPNLSSPCQHNL